MLLRQADQGLSMQNTPAPQGQNVGQTYVASSPLEHIAAAFQRYQGGQKQKTAEQGFADTLTRQTAGRGASFKAQAGQQEQQNAQIQAFIDALRQQAGGGVVPGSPQGPAGWGNGY
jgi:hypothetical protein